MILNYVSLSLQTCVIGVLNSIMCGKVNKWTGMESCKERVDIYIEYNFTPIHLLEQHT